MYGKIVCMCYSCENGLFIHADQANRYFTSEKKHFASVAKQTNKLRLGTFSRISFAVAEFAGRGFYCIFMKFTSLIQNSWFIRRFY